MRNARKLVSSFGRFIFVLLVLISAFVFAMFQGGQVSWTIFYAVLPFVFYSIALFFYPIKDLRVERAILTPGVEKGGKLVVVITVKRKWRFPLLYTAISEKWLGERPPELTKLLILGFRKEAEWTYEIKEIPRGEHVIKGVHIELFDFFGWIRKTRFIPIRNTVLVYPKTTAIHYVPIDTQYDRGTITSPFNIVKDTTLATGVRDYQTGDRVSWIHWKSFARTQTLMTKEFEDRRSQELFVILDDRPSELFEEQIEFAASVLKEALRQQAAIGFLSTGEVHTVFPSIQSEEHFGQALVYLAKIKPKGSASSVMEESHGHMLHQDRSMILITGSPNWSFIESVVSNVKSTRSIVCFAITNKDISKQKDFGRDVQFAKMKGITVHAITPSQFSEVFNEVGRA